MGIADYIDIVDSKGDFDEKAFEAAVKEIYSYKWQQDPGLVIMGPQKNGTFLQPSQRDAAGNFLPGEEPVHWCSRRFKDGKRVRGRGAKHFGTIPLRTLHAEIIDAKACHQADGTRFTFWLVDPVTGKQRTLATIGWPG